MNRLVIIAGLMASVIVPAHAIEIDSGFTVPKGFRATMVADENLANDIYAMTLDRRGRIVVTGQGYIKILHDDNGDGKADRASLFAETRTGGMGLCFDGDDLLFCGDGWLSRYRDADGDGRADGPPEQIIPLPFAEHGGHAMRKGPDGFWYIIAGNEPKTGTGISLSADSPIRRPEAGRILRLSSDLKNPTAIAHGFRNPYDFDFNANGDLFTYDSDCERDYFLPWYTPTRVYHVQHAMHHGWRLTGSSRSWARPGDYVDSVDVLQPVGRGSPTGVACYRHEQFPERYRGGLFVLDWTFGIVYFLPLKPEGATYGASLERFIEPTGTSGFAPSDIEIAPDGSLLICIGGRRTRGAVYRIEYIGAGGTEPEKAETVPPLDRVLRSHQPLSAWSRAIWGSEAKTLGAEPFLQAIADESRPEAERIRAIEIIAEMFGGLDRNALGAALKSSSAPVRERAVWAIGEPGRPETLEILQSLACTDPDPRVHLKALERLGDIEAGTDIGVDNHAFRRLLETNQGHPDKRVRLAMARLIALRTGEIESLPTSPTVLLGRMWSAEDHFIAHVLFQTEYAVRSSDLLGLDTPRQVRLDAVRLIQLGLGDYNLDRSPIEVYSGYSPSRPVEAALGSVILKKVAPIFPSGDARLDEEMARLLAMLEADEPTLPAKVAAFWTATSSPTRDFHFLAVLSRLKAPKTDHTAKIADTILNLDRKLRGQQLRTKQVWNDRLIEVIRALIASDSKLADALLDHPAFVSSAHLAIAAQAIPQASRPKAARKFLDAVKSGDEDILDWSADLFELLAPLPADEVRPLIRTQWDNLVFRDAIVRSLAENPEEIDRPKFLSGLESGDKDAVEAAISALMTLPLDPAPEHLAPAIRALRSLSLDPRKSTLPKRLVALIERQSGQLFRIDVPTDDPSAVRRSLQPIFTWFDQAYPALASQSAEGGTGEDLNALRGRLAAIDWSKGDRERGSKIFESRGCRTCHTGARALGPDLGGVTQRLSRIDLFTAIAAPSLEVAPPYRTTLVETRDGRLFSGLIAFESADGVIVQTDAATTVRLATPDILSTRAGNASLMPAGLLKELTDRDFADLDKHLQTLTTPIARSAP